MSDVKPKISSPKQLNNNKRLNYCQVCSKHVSGGTFYFKCHMFTHNKAVKPRFTCGYCSKEFFRSDTYKRHLSKHTNQYDKVYVCDYCDRYFVDKRNLLLHLKIHDDDLLNHPNLRKYECEACGVIYAESRLLKYHIRREHSDVKPKGPKFIKKPLKETWVDQVIDSNVKEQSSKLNTDVKLTKNCNLKGAENSKPDSKIFEKYLNSEERDTSQYSLAECDYCHKEMLKKSLRLHIKERHMQIKRFTCDMCKRSFKRNYQLTNHVCGKQRRGPKPNAENK